MNFSSGKAFLTSMPLSLRVGVWLLAFVSPAVYLFLLLLADRFHFSRTVPEQLVAVLFIAIPLAALLVCESLVLSAPIRVASKVGWASFTLLATLLQVGLILVLLRAILTAV